MSRIKKIEEEYGEPFEDVVRGYAEMGYSSRDIARLLGWSYETGMYYWLKKLGIKIHWEGSKSAKSREKAAQKTPAQEEVVRRLVEQNKKAHGFFYGGEFGTLKDHAIRLGLNPKTVLWRRRNAREKGPSFWLRPKQRPCPPQLREVNYGR